MALAVTSPAKAADTSDHQVVAAETEDAEAEPSRLAGDDWRDAEAGGAQARAPRLALLALLGAHLEAPDAPAVGPIFPNRGRARPRIPP